VSRYLASMIVALALCGCAGRPWLRDSATPEQADKDTVDCQRWAANEASLRAGGFYGSSYYGPYFSRRAVTRPDTGFDPDGYRQLDEARLGDFCMRAKGYQRAP
jgi:hypothetical protein